MMQGLVERFRQNSLLGSVSYSFLINIAFAALTFLLGIILARLLGRSGLGLYDYVDAWLEILLVFVLFGFDRLLIRNISKYQSESAWGLLRGLWQFALGFSLLSGFSLLLFFTVFFYFTSSSSAEFLTLFIALLLLFFRMGLSLTQGLMQGLQKTIRALIPDLLLRLAIFIFALLMLALLWQGQLAPYHAMLLHLLAAALALLIALYQAKQHVPEAIGEASAQYEGKIWLRSNSAFVLSQAASLINSRIGIIFLGQLASPQELSLFSISLRIAAVIVLAQTAMNLSIQPRIARLYAEGDFAGLQRLANFAVRTVSIVTVPLTIGIILFANWILSIFGSEFTQAYPVLVIMVIGQMLNTVAGPVGNFLTMTNYEQDVAITSIILVIITGITAYLLIPYWGAVGAAVALSSAIVLRNIVLMILVYYRLGILVSPLPSKRSKI